MREFPDEPSAQCGLCGQWLPVALLAAHFELHGLRLEIENAEVVDMTGEDES